MATFGPCGEITINGVTPVLAPDLTYPGDRLGLGTQTIKQISGIDASAGLTTALSLTGGKYVVSLLQFVIVALENITIKLTVDGIVVWNSTYLVPSATQTLLGTISATGQPELIQCNDSFLLEVQTTADTDIALRYLARKTL
tara:strand:- start:110 stop:535 length:426 start_codon:yes stop_codon:yes gene_type:complete